jgi:hypothetical protein
MTLKKTKGPRESAAGRHKLKFTEYGSVNGDRTLFEIVAVY